MSIVLGVVTLIILGIGAWSLWGVVFSAGRRLRALKRLSVSLVALMGLGFGVSYYGNHVARQAGFANYAELMDAEDAGISDPAEWEKERNRRDEARRLEAALVAEASARERAVEEAKRVEEAQNKEQTCRHDLECWGEKAYLVAAVSCPPTVERFAKYDVEWVDGVLEPKFSHYRWRDKREGVVTVLGDKVKFQNGFGAWMRMTYECDVDPATKAVLDVRVHEGRM